MGAPVFVIYLQTRASRARIEVICSVTSISGRGFVRHSACVQACRHSLKTRNLVGLARDAAGDA